MSVDVIPDLRGPVGDKFRFAIAVGLLQHPSRADEHIRLPDGPLCLQRPVCRISHADADEADRPFRRNGIALHQKMLHLKEGFSFGARLLRPADENDFGSGFSGGEKLFLKTTHFAGVFCHQISRVKLLQHRGVQLFAEGSLHADEVFSHEPQGSRHCSHLRCRKHPGIEAFFKIRKSREGFQLLASCRQKHVALRLFQILHGSCRVFHKNTVRRITALFS